MISKLSGLLGLGRSADDRGVVIIDALCVDFLNHLDLVVGYRVEIGVTHGITGELDDHHFVVFLVDVRIEHGFDYGVGVGLLGGAEEGAGLKAGKVGVGQGVERFHLKGVRTISFSVLREHGHVAHLRTDEDAHFGVEFSSA